MRSIAVIGALAVMSMLGVQRAGAVERPWCAILVEPDGGSKNCGFTTLEQCQATVQGVGGTCFQNPALSGAVEQSESRSRHYRHRR
jgi:hypothetical protein